MFKALKLFSLNLLKIAFCIFVAKIMAKSMSAEKMPKNHQTMTKFQLDLPIP
jgi:hypothetical protein